MPDNKLEFKINTDVNGDAIDLENMSVTATKSLIVILESLTKIIEETPTNDDVKIQITEGSARVTAEVSNEYIEVLEADFNSVVEHNCTNQVIVSNWRKLQSLFAANGLEYEVNFYKRGLAIPVYRQITNARQFRTKPIRIESELKIAFIKGKLMANGGKFPNMHINGENEEKFVVYCDEIQAKKISPFLYSNVFISALCRFSPEENKYLFCDIYTSEDQFSEYKEFIEDNSELDTEAELLAIHYKMKDYIELGDNFGMLRKLMRLYNYDFIDMSILKTLLIVTKGFKQNDRISPLRNEIKRLVEKKLGKSLI